ncbi:hypothetical protein GCM10022419_011110 [Nonomuraea rosea]|uniref:Uncharacterized protein n=1 Tax=Nonomuraea rosea TaxID=638574 RepID=A0ABP6VGN9_9ACTN
MIRVSPTGSSGRSRGPVHDRFAYVPAVIAIRAATAISASILRLCMSHKVGDPSSPGVIPLAYVRRPRRAGVRPREYARLSSLAGRPAGAAR